MVVAEKSDTTNVLTKISLGVTKMPFLPDITNVLKLYNGFGNKLTVSLRATQNYGKASYYFRGDQTLNRKAFGLTIFWKH